MLELPSMARLEFLSTMDLRPRERPQKMLAAGLKKDLKQRLSNINGGQQPPTIRDEEAMRYGRSNL
jgi:hypothetical protein